MNSLYFRALLAVLLMIGFYLIALALAGGLLAIPVLVVKYANRIPIKLLLISFLAGISILWSILPRFDKFEAPGPLLTPKDHPRLFGVLNKIAVAAGQPMPHEVYLVPDVNAWVAHRGGIMGFGSRPVMGLGLLLMQTLTVDEFRAVLAHEFGHYHSSDTKLGPWTYKTRAAIGRTLGSLGDSVLSKPFEWYGKLFLIVTNKVSRNQEFVADRVAAQIAGAQHVATSLVKTHGAGAACGVYLDTEVLPMLGAGYKPPIAAGFTGFMRAKSIGEQVGKMVESEMKEGKTNLYDTHPPLNERLEAVRDLPPGASSDDRLAITLLENIDDVEKALLQSAMGKAKVEQLKPISWDDAMDLVYAPGWHKLIEKNEAALRGVLPSNMPDLLADNKFGLKLRTTDGDQPPPHMAAGFAVHVLGTALGLKLEEQGWEINCELGESISFERGGQTFEPFAVLRELSEKKMSKPKWLAKLTELQIPDVPIV